ncbi:hypothetical protein O0L34_g18613 [Tuta absoluta]|nr:hypothetical protein O0L34_g18613 [Tuta absoluta]
MSQTQKGTRPAAGGLRLDFSATNASKSGTTPKSAGKTAASGTRTPESLSRKSNRFYQEAKSLLEQSKLTTKESVITKLTGMYECILEYQEAAQKQTLEIEKLKTRMNEALLAKEAEHCKELQETTALLQKMDVRTPIAEVANQIKSIRDIISFDVIGKIDIARSENAKILEKVRPTTSGTSTNQQSTELMNKLIGDIKQHKEVIVECSLNTKILTEQL